MTLGSPGDAEDEILRTLSQETCLQECVVYVKDFASDLQHNLEDIFHEMMCKYFRYF